jgi:hypothetical protein
METRDQRVWPCASLVSLVLSITGGILFVSFKQVRVLKRFVLDDEFGRSALEHVQAWLATEWVFALCALFIAIWAVRRSERRWAWMALAVAVIGIVFRFTYM